MGAGRQDSSLVHLKGAAARHDGQLPQRYDGPLSGMALDARACPRAPQRCRGSRNLRRVPIRAAASPWRHWHEHCSFSAVSDIVPADALPRHWAQIDRQGAEGSLRQTAIRAPPPWWRTSDKEVYDVVSTYPLVTRSATGADYRIDASGYRLTHWWTFAQRTGSGRVLRDRPRCVRSGLHTAGLHPVKGEVAAVGVAAKSVYPSPCQARVISIDRHSRRPVSRRMNPLQRCGVAGDTVRQSWAPQERRHHLVHTTLRDLQHRCGHTARPRDIRPRTSMTTKTIRKRKKRSFAIPAAAEAIPPNPNKAATSATTKKTTAQYNIGYPPLVNRHPTHVPILGATGLTMLNPRG